MSAAARIVLVGSMGSGKSTVMELLASRLGCPGVDTDEIVEDREGRTIAEVFSSEGEDMFRSLELSALEAALSWPAPVVIATGGGIVETPAARRLLTAQPSVVHLRVSPGMALDRIGSATGRPLLGDDAAASLISLEARRRGWWREVSDVVVDVDARTPDEVADLVLSSLGITA